MARLSLLPLPLRLSIRLVIGLVALAGVAQAASGARDLDYGVTHSIDTPAIAEHPPVHEGDPGAAAARPAAPPTAAVPVPVLTQPPPLSGSGPAPLAPRFAAARAAAPAAQPALAKVSATSPPPSAAGPRPAPPPAPPPPQAGTDMTPPMGPPPSQAIVRQIIVAAAQRHGVDPNWMIAIAQCESSLNPYAQNPSGPYDGLFQFLPSTFHGHGGTDIWDANQQAEITAGMLAGGQSWAWSCA